MLWDPGCGKAGDSINVGAHFELTGDSTVGLQTTLWLVGCM